MDQEPQTTPLSAAASVHLVLSTLNTFQLSLACPTQDRSIT